MYLYVLNFTDLKTFNSYNLKTPCSRVLKVLTIVEEVPDPKEVVPEAPGR